MTAISPHRPSHMSVSSHPANDDTCPFGPLFAIYAKALNATARDAWVHGVLHMTTEASIVNHTGAAILLAISVALLFFGSRLVRPTFFIVGFVSATLFFFVATQEIFTSEAVSADTRCWVMASISLVAGIAGGFMTLRLVRVAFGATGLIAGGALGFLLYTVGLNRLGWPEDPEFAGHGVVFWAPVCICAVLGAIAMMRYEYAIFAVATATIGAAGLIPALDLLLLYHIDERFLWALSDESRVSHHSSPFVFGQAIAAIIMAQIGAAFQLRFFAHRLRMQRVMAVVAVPYGEPLMVN